MLAFLAWIILLAFPVALAAADTDQPGVPRDILVVLSNILGICSAFVLQSSLDGTSFTIPLTVYICLLATLDFVRLIGLLRFIEDGGWPWLSNILARYVIWVPVIYIGLAAIKR